MATSVYSTSFLAVHNGSDATVTIPDGQIAVIRCITCFCNSVEPASPSVYIEPFDTTIWATFIATLTPGESGYRENGDLRIVVPSGGQIVTNNARGCDLTVNGYLLTAP